MTNGMRGGTPPRVVADVRNALVVFDVPLLKKSLALAETLLLATHPDVARAARELDRVVRTAAAREGLRSFLDDPLGAAVDDVPALIEEAAALNLEGVARAREAYAGVARALDARKRLRRGVDAADDAAVDAAFREVADLDKPPKWPEVRAARAFTRMRAFAAELGVAPAGGPLLTPATLELCFRVELASVVP